jgi:murein DD-endopeptidase MepM/ murein hydrolase activator NlpD
MAGKQHTVIVVPHSRAAFRKFRISNLQIGLLAVLLVLLTAVGSWTAWSYVTVTHDEAQLDLLKQENDELREVNHTFEVSIRQLQQQLTEYEDRTRKLAIVAGLEDYEADTAAGAMGGPNVPEPTLGALSDQASTVTETLDQIETKLQDQLAWISSVPAVAPVKGLYTSGFGYRQDPFTKRRAFHSGLDATAPRGQGVIATADGIITRSGWYGRLGKAVVISHGYGITTFYGHLSKTNVEPGEQVKRGDVVGFVGSTGRSTGSHLHYEVRVDGKPVDPMGYILGDYAGS